MSRSSMNNIYEGDDSSYRRLETMEEKSTRQLPSPLAVIVRTLVALLSLALIIATDFAYKDALFEKSVDSLIPSI